MLCFAIQKRYIHILLKHVLRIKNKLRRAAANHLNFFYCEILARVLWISMEQNNNKEKHFSFVEQPETHIYINTECIIPVAKIPFCTNIKCTLMSPITFLEHDSDISFVSFFKICFTKIRQLIGNEWTSILDFNNL